MEQLLRNIRHFFRFGIRYCSRALIPRHVALFSEMIHLLYQRCVRIYGVCERLQRPEMVSFPARSITRRGQRRRRDLKRGAVRKIESAVGTQARDSRIREIPIGYGEQLRDLLAARLMLDDPAVSQPVLQAHVGFQSGISSRP